MAGHRGGRERGGSTHHASGRVAFHDATGLREYLVIDGTARITQGGAAELLERLAHTYLGPEVVFPAMPDPPQGFVTRVRVERVSGIGLWRR